MKISRMFFFFISVDCNYLLSFYLSRHHLPWQRFDDPLFETHEHISCFFEQEAILYLLKRDHILIITFFFLVKIKTLNLLSVVRLPCPLISSKVESLTGHHY